MKRWKKISPDTVLIILGLLIAYTGLAALFVDLQRVQAATERAVQELQSLGMSEAASPAGDRQVSALAIPTTTVPPGVVDAAQNPGLPVETQAAPAPPVLTGEPQLTRQPEEPKGLYIPAIDLNAPIVPAETVEIEVRGRTYRQWAAPDQYAAGWHTDSARLGEPGNTVLNGHHNIFGEVFRDLDKLEEGDEILIYSDNHVYRYQIANKMILPEKYEAIDTRMDNAVWILPSPDERVTLITCWPYESNTHRLIIVARPVP